MPDRSGYRDIGTCYLCNYRIVDELDGGPDNAEPGEMSHYCCRAVDRDLFWITDEDGHEVLRPEFERRTPKEIEQDRLEDLGEFWPGG